jgi:hypothetical protein
LAITSAGLRELNQPPEDDNDQPGYRDR